MGLPVLLKKIFESDGYGPKLNRSVIPFAASLASASSSDVASAGWVKGLVDAEVYVDASVSSSGDGLTSATAVKTIAEGVELLKQYPSGSGKKTRLHIAGGTYNETVYLQNIKCDLDLSGNVTINGILGFNYFVGTIGTDSSTTLTVSSIVIEHEAYAYFSCKVVVNGNANGVTIYHHSYCQFNADISIATNSHVGILLGGHSSAYFNGNLTISNSSIGLTIYDYGLVTVDSDSATITSSNIGIECANKGFGFIKPKSLSITSTGQSAFKCGTSSVLAFYDFDSFTVTHSGQGSTAVVWQCSYIELYTKSGATFTVNKSNTGDCFESNAISIFRINGSGTVKYSGKSSITAHAWGHGYLLFSSSLSVSGSFSEGKRYDVGTLSVIDVSGAGANRFPGTINGSVGTRSSYYV